ERVIDLRVEEGDGSLVELRRLLERALAYRAANSAETGRATIAGAAGLPDTHVRLLAVWDAAERGDLEDAQAQLAELERADPRWRDARRSSSLAAELAGVEQLCLS